MWFDPRYLVTMASFMSLVMAIVLFSMWRSYPRSIGGLAEWSAAPLVWCVSMGLFVARDSLPTLLGIVAANTLLVAGTLLFYLGSRSHFSAPVLASWRVWAAMVLVCALALAWFTYVSPSFSARVDVMALVMISLVLAHAALLLRQPRRGFAVWLTLTVLAVQALVWVFRVSSAMASSGSSQLFAPSATQAIFVGSAALVLPLITIACVLAASDKLRTELEQMTRHDTLTRALTRRAILQVCEDEILRSRRHAHPLSLMMLDLDNFKAINDAHGHQHGDAILVAFARRTEAMLRPSDRLGRYGGEEFVLLLPETNRSAALRVAERIHAAGLGDDPLSWTVSIGLSHWMGPTDTLHAMLARADAALYRAKRQGRNQTQVG